jgi:hypothetical protein
LCGVLTPAAAKMGNDLRDFGEREDIDGGE